MTDFYEDDEPIEKIHAIFDRGPDCVAEPPTGAICGNRIIDSPHAGFRITHVDSCVIDDNVITDEP